jgi:hypothetical protein
MPGVVGEDGGVAGGEVEGAGCGLDERGEVSWRSPVREMELFFSGWDLVLLGWRMTYVPDKDSSTSGAGKEVKPLFSLRFFESANAQSKRSQRSLTFGCQCNSLSAPGLSVTIDEAIVWATGKFLESTVLTVPPPPGTSSAAISLALKT